MVEAVGGGRTGIRLSPVTPANDVVRPRSAAAVRLRRAQARAATAWPTSTSSKAPPAARAISGKATEPFDYEALKAAYREAGGKGAWMVNNGYDKELAEDAVGTAAPTSSPSASRSSPIPTWWSASAPTRAERAGQGHLLRRRREGLYRLSTGGVRRNRGAWYAPSTALRRSPSPVNEGGLSVTTAPILQRIEV